MSAKMTYELIGKTRRGAPVQLTIRAIAKPNIEVAEYLLREKWPSAKLTDILIPAARGYKQPEQKTVDLTKIDAQPIRRQGL